MPAHEHTIVQLLFSDPFLPRSAMDLLLLLASPLMPTQLGPIATPTLLLQIEPGIKIVTYYDLRSSFGLTLTHLYSKPPVSLCAYPPSFLVYPFYGSSIYPPSSYSITSQDILFINRWAPRPSHPLQEEGRNYADPDHQSNTNARARSHTDSLKHWRKPRPASVSKRQMKNPSFSSSSSFPR